MLFIFSTQLANKANEAVKSGQFPNIIAFHQSLEDTKRFLTKNNSALPKPPSQPQSLQKVPSRLSSTSAPSPRFSAEDASPSPTTPKFLVKSEFVDGVKSQDEKVNSDSKPPSIAAADCVFSPAAATASDSGNLPLTDVPFSNQSGDPLEKMARLTQETLPFEPPLKQRKLASPRDNRNKLSDDQLTPAQRQHRNEALTKLDVIKNVFGISPNPQQQQQQQAGVYLTPPAGQNQAPPMLVMPANQEAMICDPSCSNPVDAQLKWRQMAEEHEIEKKCGKGGSLSDPVAVTVPTMMVQGKPAVMVHPVAAPRNMNPRAMRPRMMPPPMMMPDGFYQQQQMMGPGGGFDGGPQSFCGNFEFGGGGGPMQQRFVMQPNRMHMFAAGGRPPPPGAMNLNMNIHVGPPQGPPDSCWNQQAEFECDEAFYEGNVGFPPGPGMNVPPMSANTFYYGPGGMVPDEQPQQRMPPDGGQFGPGGKAMVNNTFVNATMSIQQVNIQNVGPYPPGNIVRVQSMQPSATVPYMMQTSGGPSQQRRPGNMQMMAPGPGGQSTPPRFYLQDFAEPLRNLDSKVPSQKLQYFPTAAQSRPFEPPSSAPPLPGGGPSDVHLQQQQQQLRDNGGPPPNVFVTYGPGGGPDGRPGGGAAGDEASFQTFQQQLYSMNPRRSGSFSS